LIEELSILQETLFVIVLAAATVLIIKLIIVIKPQESDEVKRLRSEISTLRELLKSKDAQIESLRKDYESRIKEIHERTSMLEGIYNALKKGRIRIVSNNGEECRVLVDGTIICGDRRVWP